MRVTTTITLLACGLLVPACHDLASMQGSKAMQRKVETGLLSKTIEVGDTVYRYAVYVPAEYTPEKPWPAVLFLHGIQERGDDGWAQTRVGIWPAIAAYPDRFGCIVVMPQCQDEQDWCGPMADVALAALDATLDQYEVDENRVVLTGLSMGGFGTWCIGARRPERFSALVPICGGGDPKDAADLAKVPAWCYHGDADGAVPVERSREMVDAIRAAGGEVRYNELAGVGHNSWDPAYGNPQVIAWMLAQQRNRP
jgi:predicted peptidase